MLLACSPQVRGHDPDRAELERLREEYFAVPRACLRASRLPKAFGWGLHCDDQIRITLCAVDFPDYAPSQRPLVDPTAGHAVKPPRLTQTSTAGLQGTGVGAPSGDPRLRQPGDIVIPPDRPRLLSMLVATPRKAIGYRN